MATARDRILEVSEELFRRQGITGTGLKQILEQAHAPFGSLYHHFPGGKNELAAVTIERAGAHYAALVAASLGDPGDDAPGRLRRSFEGAAETLRTTDYADACPIETVALEVASTDEELRQATARVFDSWTEQLMAWLAGAGVPAEVRRDLALTILSALEGAFVLARATRAPDAVLAAGQAMERLLDAALRSNATAVDR